MEGPEGGACEGLFEPPNQRLAPAARSGRAEPSRWEAGLRFPAGRYHQDYGEVVAQPVVSPDSKPSEKMPVVTQVLGLSKRRMLLPWRR